MCIINAMLYIYRRIIFEGGGLGRGFFPNETQDSVLKKNVFPYDGH